MYILYSRVLTVVVMLSGTQTALEGFVEGLDVTSLSETAVWCAPTVTRVTRR